MAMSRRNWAVIGTIIGVMAGIGFSVWLGRLVSGVPAGGVILAVVLVAAAVLACVGRWLGRAPLWMRKFSSAMTKAPRVTGIAAAVLVIASITAVMLWVEDLERVDRAAVAAERAREATEARAEVEKMLEEAKAKAADEAAEAEAKAAAEARVQKLRALTSENAARFRKEMQEVEELLGRGSAEQAEERMKAMLKEIAEYKGMEPSPAEIAMLFEPMGELSDRIARIITIQTAVHDLDAYKGQAEGMTMGGNDSSGWSTVLEMYQQALDQITTLERVTDDERRFIPAGLNLKRERRAIEGKMKTARRRFEKAKEEETRAEMYRVVCGEMPPRSAWDGEVYAVTRAVKEVAHDPRSIEVKNCSPPVLTKKDCWRTTCDVRGKNVFGGMVLNRKTFSISTLGVSEL